MIVLTHAILLFVSTGLCRLCEENNCYMLAFECFEERWKFPKAYHLFYDSFFKAAVGEKRWKESLAKDKPFGNSNTEAFAFMVLKNNYHAWLAQAKSELRFFSQYDLEIIERKPVDQRGEEEQDLPTESILEEVLPKFQYYEIPQDEEQGVTNRNSYSRGNGTGPGTPQSNLEGDAGSGINVVHNPSARRRLLSRAGAGEDDSDNDGMDEEGEDCTTPGRALRLDYRSSWCIVTEDGDPEMYLKALSLRNSCLAKARSRISASDLDDYSSAVERLNRLDANATSAKSNGSVSKQRGRKNSKAALLLALDENIEDAATVSAVQEQRETEPHAKKRRKILKELKRFTKKGDVRCVKQKGWSSEGYRYHVELTTQILEEEPLVKPFVDLFRKLTTMVEGKMEEITHPNKKERYDPDRKVVWQLG